MIKAVIFDHGGVLVDNQAPTMYSHYSKSLDVSQEQLLQLLRKYETDWQKGKISENELWEKVTTELHTTMPQVESLWLDGFLNSYKEKDEMLALIKKIKRNNYKVALLSNTETPIMNHIKKQSWPDFDLFVYSCEVGMRKPDKDIYEYTLSNLGIKASEAVFIDDREENIEAAKKLGIMGILFKNPAQVITDLQQSGVSLE